MVEASIDSGRNQRQDGRQSSAELRTELQSHRNRKQATSCCRQHRKERKKKRKHKPPKVVLKGEQFEDPDPYQLAVRKTNYGKRKEKLKFVGEQFHDPDPYGLAIRKTSSTSSCTSDHEVSYQYRTQFAETHPATVYSTFDYINRKKIIAEMPEDESASELETEAKKDSGGGNRRAAIAQACAVGVKNVLLLGYGMTLGFPTIVIPAIQGGDGRQPALEKDVTLSNEQISWLSSINLICVPLGSVFSGMLAQPIGRRRAMQLINIPIFIAWMLFHYANDVTFLYLGLALAGLSGGLGEAPVLTYVAEITQPRYRGMLAATGSTCVILGVLLEFLMGSFLKWRTVALVSSAVPVLAALLLFLIPESPVWLASKGRLEESQAALAWLRGWVSQDEVDEEFKELEQQMKKATELEKDFTIVDKARLYTQRAFLQPFGIILLCFFIGHFSGMTTLQTYAVQIFHTLKAPINKYYATCLLGLTELIGTLFCVFLVHRTGKRPLIFISTIGCAACFFGAASYAYFLNAIPGASVQNVVANVSSIKADIAVIPLRSKEVIAEWQNSPALQLLNLTTIESQLNGSTTVLEAQPNRNDSSKGILYAAQSFNNYYLNASLDEPINITIHYGEYVKSAIPKDVFVPLPHVNRNKLVWVPLTLLLGSAFLTHIGIRLIPWILIGELFAPNVRSGGSGLAGGIAYIFGFIANKTFLKMLAVFSLPGTFWIYSLVTIIGAIILYKVLPETEGKTLQEIETYFLSPSKRSARFDQEAPAPRPGPKLSTGSGAAIKPLPPPIPPKPFPLKDDLDRARRISFVPRQMSQSSRNTTVSDFSVASNDSQQSHQSELSRSSSRTSFTLEDTHDLPTQQIFRRISETPPELTPSHHSKNKPPAVNPADVGKHLSDTHPKLECPSPPATRRRGSAAEIHHHHHNHQPHLFRGTYEMSLKLPPHKPHHTRAHGKRPTSSHVLDFNASESNRKFEEFLHRRQGVGVSSVKPAQPMRHVTSAHDLKAFENAPSTTHRRGSASGMHHHHPSRGSYEMDLKLSAHKTHPMTRPVRARAKRPPPCHVLDLNTWDSNRKFEEFLHRHHAQIVSTVRPPARPMRHVTSVHDLKGFESEHHRVSIPGGKLADQQFFNGATKLSFALNGDRRDHQFATDASHPTSNAAFLLSSSDESTDM